MSDRTNNFSLPLIYQNQSQKEILINESLTIIDSILAKGAISITSTPPSLPNNGDLYIVGASATGAWVGKDDQIAYYVTEWGWQFYQPQEGYTIRVIADEKLYSYTATGWELTLQSFDNLTKLGINATADTTNRLSVSSPAVLFNRETDDIQVKVNKSTAGDNASFLFQTGFSSRAEIGLTGDDDFHFKVSPDGSTWYDAITIDKDTGNVSLTGGGGGGGGSWGSITGTLSSQIDLQTALDGKVDENSAITGATKTKITYDAKGLVTAGADATTADISDSTNKRYVTDAQLVVIGNTSGTNTGDQTSIAGITGTKSQFDTACTDGNFLYSGDVTQYTDEMAQDAVGAMIDGSLNYVDGTPLLQRAALTGDVTASAGSNATTIVNDAVTFAKIQNIATDKLLGRSTASTGDIEELSVGSNLTLSSGTLDGTSSCEVVSLTPSASQNNYSTGAILTNEHISSEIKIAPTNTIKITGIDATSAANGKKIRLRNTTSASAATSRLIILERLNSSSSAANQLFWEPTTIPMMLMPGDYIDFVYNATSSRWEFVGGNRHANPYQFFEQWNDFIGSSAPFTTQTNGTGATTSISTNFGANTTQKSMGEIANATGTSTTGGSQVGSSASMTVGALGSALYLGRVAVDTLSDGTNTYKVNCGFNDAGGSTASVDGVWWEYDSPTSTDWRTVSSSNSTTTKNTVTGFTVSNTVMHYLGIFLNGDWTQADFFYSTDGETWTISSTSHTANLPGTTRAFGVRNSIIKSAGTSTRNLINDFMGWRYITRRGA